MEERKRAIALGFFDGVHIGHSALLERVLAVSEDRGYIPSVLTFDSHPMSMVTGKSVKLINTPEDRAGLISRIFGIDDVISIHFDEETMRMPWDEFIERLVSRWNAGYLVVGHDHRFGYKGQGTPELLKEKCREMGIGCDVIAPVIYDGVISSSTYIRRLIELGETEKAGEYLGHPHVLTGIVAGGYKLGRTIGSPTINMTFPDGVLVPAHGVYAAKVYLPGGEFTGVTNIGTRPTVSDGSRVTAETYILDFSGNLYGKTVRIEFFKMLRPEMKFDGIEELKAQIAKDVQSVREYFA